MKMKPYPWKCGRCRERAVTGVVLENSRTELEHDGRKYQVELTDFQVAKCQHCGAMVFDDAANRRLSDGLRSAAGLLQPGEIRASREALGLTQKSLANLLQIAESTLSRWETGAQIQQRCMDRMLRGFFGVKEFRDFLGSAGDSAAIPAEMCATA
jgi:putative zinc finger/helix-turn-helix YgiT family protein